MSINIRSGALNGTTTTSSPQGTLPLFIILTLLLAAALSILQWLTEFQFTSTLLSAGLWSVIVLLVWRGLPYHAHRYFGVANAITATRALMTALLAGCAVSADAFAVSQAGMWYLTGATILALSLDGLDGWIARKTGMTSPFGARFDMEIDALLILVLAIAAWQANQAGIWILALGLMRYTFFASGTFLPALNAPLFPSMRRKIVCVVQVLALCLMLIPWIQPPLSSLIGLFALFCLCISFAVDTRWLLNTSKSTQYNT